MTTTPLFISRGNSLFIKFDGDPAPTPFINHPQVKAICEANGTTITVARTPQQQGNYLVQLDSGSWNGEVTSFQRANTLVEIHKAMESWGIPARAADGELVLNLQLAGSRMDNGPGRRAFLGLYLNLSVLEKRADEQVGGGPTVDPMADRLSSAISNFLERGGDVSVLEALEAKWASKGTAIFVGMLEGMTKKLGGAEPPAVPVPETPENENPI